MKLYETLMLNSNSAMMIDIAARPVPLLARWDITDCMRERTVRNAVFNYACIFCAGLNFSYCTCLARHFNTYTKTYSLHKLYT